MPLRRAPLAADRRELLAGAEVVDEAEADVGHRLAVGDGDRERVGGDRPAHVHRAVDRVDHDPSAPARPDPSRTSPRSSLTAESGVPAAAIRSSSSKTMSSQRRSSFERHVPALAAPLVEGPRGDSPGGREQVRLPGGHPPADVEPVDLGIHGAEWYW